MRPERSSASSFCDLTLLQVDYLVMQNIPKNKLEYSYILWYAKHRVWNTYKYFFEAGGHNGGFTIELFRQNIYLP